MNSILSYLLEDKQAKLQAARDATWAKYGPAIREKTRTAASQFIPPAVKLDMYRDYVTTQAMSRNMPIHQQSSFLHAAEKHPHLLFTKEGVPDDLLRKHVEDQVRAAVPHHKYEAKMMQFLAARPYGSVNDVSGLSRLEDVNTIGEYMKDYHTLAQKKWLDPKLMARANYVHSRGDAPVNPIPHTDFSRFTSFNHFLSVTRHPLYETKLAQEQAASLKEGQDYHVVHEDDEVKVYHPITHLGARALAVAPDNGERARWCTAINASKLFNEYNALGPLLIMHPKQPKEPGEQYQYHRQSHQLMNASDRPHPVFGVKRGVFISHQETYKALYPKETAEASDDSDYIIKPRFKNFGRREAEAYGIKWGLKNLKGKT